MKAAAQVLRADALDMDDSSTLDFMNMDETGDGQHCDSNDVKHDDDDKSIVFAPAAAE